MYLNRAAEQPLKDILASAKVGIVLGARQVGKTTLVEHVLAGQRALFLNFDVEVDKARFQAAAALAPGDGLRSLGNPAVLVIDEAQRPARLAGGAVLLAHAGAVRSGFGRETGQRPERV